VGATRGTISLGQKGEFKGAEYSEFRNRSVSGSPLEAEDVEKAGLGIEHPILQVAVYDGVERVNEIIELPQVMTTSATSSRHRPTHVRGKSACLSRSRVESLGVFAASFEDMSMTSPYWRALGQAVLVYFAVGGAAVTAQDTQPGRAAFAEMIAFARLASVPCQRLAPDADSFHALALRRLIQPPITEEQIAAKEKDIKRLQVRLGLSRWCKRYVGQMEQARILVQVLRRQN